MFKNNKTLLKTTLLILKVLLLLNIKPTSASGIHRFPRSNGWTLNSIGYNAGLGALSRMFGGEKPNRGFKRASRAVIGKPDDGPDQYYAPYWRNTEYLKRANEKVGKIMI